MTDTGDFSHVFRTRICRSFPIRATTTKQHGSAVKIATQDTGKKIPHHGNSHTFADPYVTEPVKLDSNSFDDSPHQLARSSKVPSKFLSM
jgi:hypothetical protein